MIQSLKLQRWSLCLLLVAFVALPLAGCKASEPKQDEAMGSDEMAPATEMTTEEPMATSEEAATATLKTADGTDVGTVHFTSDGGEVHVVADLHGVEGAGMHGFHVHETGDCTPPDFKSAGGHFNPAGVDHACPPTMPRHAGDMGNVEVDEAGNATFEYTSGDITLAAGDHSIVGKAVVLHAGEDDCASQPSGAAGARLACGVITESGAMGMDDSSMGDSSMGDDAMSDDAMGGDEGGGGH